MVASPIRPRAMSEADAPSATRPEELPEDNSGMGARRIISGALDMDTARLVSDALGFVRPSDSGVSHPVNEKIFFG